MIYSVVYRLLRTKQSTLLGSFIHYVERTEVVMSKKAWRNLQQQISSETRKNLSDCITENTHKEVSLGDSTVPKCCQLNLCKRISKVSFSETCLIGILWWINFHMISRACPVYHCSCHYSFTVCSLPSFLWRYSPNRALASPFKVS
jgi:hypothetical protein